MKSKENLIMIDNLRPVTGKLGSLRADLNCGHGRGAV